MASIAPQEPRVWIITEGIIGTENQCVGVAEALGVKAEVKRIQLAPLYKFLSPWIAATSNKAFLNPEVLEYGDTPPDLVIGSGRKSLAAMQYLRHKLGNKVTLVQLQDPRALYDMFDLIAIPDHDPARGPNVIRTITAPVRLTEQKIKEGEKHFAPILGKLPAPRYAVMIGGNSQAYRITQPLATHLCEKLEALVANGASLMITVSRRTPPHIHELLAERLTGKNIYFWDGEGENPYFGMLAWADALLVTSDSTSMLSDAAATGKPVYILPLLGGNKRFERFHHNLTSNGIARFFKGDIAHWEYEPQRASATIAQHIRGLLEKRGFTFQ